MRREDAHMTHMTHMEPTMSRAPQKHVDIRELAFEQALRELEGIVGRLERGDVALEESIAIYERGEALRDHCDRLLRQAEAKVEKLTLAQDGTPKGTEPLDPER
jgi:exodeoxyribonuclease VII small subunit